MNATKNDAAQAIDDHGRAIDALHDKLAATPGADKDRLRQVVDKYKAAHKVFHDDALGCMN